MPKGRKITITSKEPEPDDLRTWKPEPARESVIDPEDAELDEVFSDFPQNEACIELYRVAEQGGRPRFLERISPATFDFAYVTEKFGGGKYQAKGKYKDGSKVRMPFEIEGDSFPVKRILPKIEPGKDSPIITLGQPTYSDHDDGTASEGGNQALVSLMRAMMSEMKNSEVGFLEKLRLYKELFAPPTQPNTPIESMISMFQKGVEVAGMAEGGGGPWWLPILRELKEPLTKIVDTVQMSVAKQPIRTAPPTVTQPAIATAEHRTSQPSVAEPLPTEAGNMMMLQLKAILPMLINGAAKNTDPTVYIDFVLDQLPVSGYDGLRDWLLKPDCLESLAQIEPGIRFQQEWWNGLRSGLLEALQEELGHAVRPIHPSSNPDSSAEPSPDHDEVS
jgi:hypothetical protein